MEYQLENAESRIRHMLKNVRESMKAGATDVRSIKSFLDFEIDTLSHLNKEIVDESMVKKGCLGEVCGDAANGSNAKRSKSSN